MTSFKPLVRQCVEKRPFDTQVTASRMAAFKASLRRFALFIRSQKDLSSRSLPHDAALFKQWQQLIVLGRPHIPNEQRLLEAMATLHHQASGTNESVPYAPPASTGVQSVGHSLSSSAVPAWMGSPEIKSFQTDRMVDYTSWDEMDYEGDDVATTHRLIRGFYRFTRHHLPPKDPIEIAIFLVMEYHFIFDLSVKMVEITKKMKQVGPIVYEWDRAVIEHNMGDGVPSSVWDPIVSKVAILDSLPIQDAILTNEVFFQRMTPKPVTEFVHDMMGSLSHVKQFISATKQWVGEIKSQQKGSV